jgi:hypothetical protein
MREWRKSPFVTRCRMKTGDNVNINSIAVWSGAAAAFAALIVALVNWLQLRHSRFALGVDIILKQEALFDAAKMRADRSRAASALKNGTDATDLEPVLDFFEIIGLLVRRGAIDKEIAWNYYSHWVLRYAAFARAQINARRKVELDETYYQEFEYLVKVLTQLDIKKRRLKSPPFYSPEVRETFLKEEIEISD